MRFLFAAYLRTHFASLFPSAAAVKAAGHDCCFYFACNYAGFAADMERLAQIGIRCIRADGSSVDVFDLPLWKAKREIVYIHAHSYLESGQHLIRTKLFYGKLLKIFKADILVIPEENLSYLTQMLVKAVRYSGGKAVVLPYTIDNPCEAAEAYYQRRQHLERPGHRSLFGRVYPRWLREHKGVKVFRLPYRAASTMQLLGFSPPDPWQNTCSFSDAVAVESLRSCREHKKSGVAESKLYITGSVVLDNMAVIQRNVLRLRAELVKELEMEPSRPIFLAAIPPDQFNTQRPDCEFVSHDEVVTFWINGLAATGWNVVVNLHPHLNPEKIALGNHPNVRLCQRPVAELLPLCDVFVACISATIRWAIAAAKPVLNHDLYRYGYDDYRSAPGVVHVTTRDEFSREVARIVADAAYLEEIRLAQAAVAEDWGVLDGKSGERLLDLFSLLRQRQ